MSNSGEFGLTKIHPLYEKGWRQGSLFQSDHICFLYNRPASPVEPVSAGKKTISASHRLVVVTQDCDIAHPSEEPYIEAMLCSKQDQKFVDRLSLNSARRFVIDRERRLVAEAKYRVVIGKDLLLSCDPEEWPGGQEQHDRFRAWLGRRYTRPALDDIIVKKLQDPLRIFLDSLEIGNPEVVADFTRAVRDVRLKLPAESHAPFVTQLLLILKSSGLSEDEANAIDFVMNSLTQGVDAESIILESERKVTADALSLADFEKTAPIYLDYMTYRGNEILGAEPPDR
jgi:hypothetical protein